MSTWLHVYLATCLHGLNAYMATCLHGLHGLHGYMFTCLHGYIAYMALVVTSCLPPLVMVPSSKEAVNGPDRHEQMLYPGTQLFQLLVKCGAPTMGNGF